MENRIKRLLTCLKIEYILFWVLPMLLVSFYELEILPEGLLVNDPRSGYGVEVAGILLAVTLIPLSLRLFSLSLMQSVKQRPLAEALVSYRRWSEVRIALLLVPALINLSSYYWTLNNTGLLCAGMVMVASLFCVPCKERLRAELDLDSSKGEDL